MSALFTDMLVVVAVAMTVAVGGDTEELMREDVWEVAGLCEDLKALALLIHLNCRNERRM
jgi:hypothetical protein